MKIGTLLSRIHVLANLAGAACNLACAYCFRLPQRRSIFFE